MIILKEIWDYNKAEMFCVSIAVKLREEGIEVSVFCDNITGNDSTDRMHEKGVKLYDFEHKSTEFLMPEYDAVVALDNWAVDNFPSGIKCKSKFRISDSKEVDDAIEMIIEKMQEKSETPKVEKEKIPEGLKPAKKVLITKAKSKTKKAVAKKK